jgi:hypothetical protein
LGAVVFVFELRAEGVGHELPQADAAERRPSLGEPKEVIRDVDRGFHAENRSRKYGTVNAVLRVAMLGNSPANGTSASVGRAAWFMRSNSRGWSGWMRPDRGGAKELPIRAQG